MQEKCGKVQINLGGWVFIFSLARVAGKTERAGHAGWDGLVCGRETVRHDAVLLKEKFLRRELVGAVLRLMFLVCAFAGINMQNGARRIMFGMSEIGNIFGGRA